MSEVVHIDIQQKFKKLKKSIILNAFCEGLIASHHLTIFFLYSNFFKATSEDYQIFETIISFKFSLIPLLGYLVDHYKIFGHK